MLLFKLNVSQPPCHSMDHAIRIMAVTSKLDSQRIAIVDRISMQ
jgi:hypothetical protein